MLSKLNQNQAHSAISNLIESGELGDSDCQALTKLRPLINSEGRLNLAEVLATLHPQSANQQQAQTLVRNLRQRIKAAAELAQLPGLELKSDSKKRHQSEQRWLWWVGDSWAQAINLARSMVEVNPNYDEHNYVEPQAQPKSYKIFVSYAHADANARTTLLECLKAAQRRNPTKLDFWIDKQHILIGANWHQSIQQAIAECSAGLLLLSPSALASGYIKKYEIPPLLAKGLLPVGLSRFDFDQLQQVTGLQERQVFLDSDYDPGLFFNQCIEPAPRRAFAKKLLAQIEQALSEPEAERTYSRHHGLLDRLPAQCADNYPELDFVEGEARRTNLQQVGASSGDAPRGESIPILEAIDNWIAGEAESSPPLLALLGEFGSGKTFTCRMLNQRLIKRIEEGATDTPTPLYVDLRLSPTYQDNRLPTLEQIIAEALRHNESTEAADLVLQQARQGNYLIIFDGLDEKLTHYHREQQEQFLGELWRLFPKSYRDALSARAQWQQRARERSTAEDKDAKLPAAIAQALAANRCRMLLSCRDHFFRSTSEQNAFLQGYLRAARSGEDYQGWSLLPFSPEQVREYLAKRFGEVRAPEIERLIEAIHNLRDLASRPLTLSLIGQHIPELEADSAAGRSVNAARLYQLMIKRLLHRDDGKHQLLPRHKLWILQDLAAELWRQGQRSLEVDALDQWLEDWLHTHPRVRASALSAEQQQRLAAAILENDLRTATLLVRDGADAFRFAHSSIQEYCLAGYLLRSLADDQRAAWQLSKLSPEVLDFFGQLLQLEPEDKRNELLAKLNHWKAAYQQQVSENLFAYCLRARESDYPSPNLHDFDLSGAELDNLTLQDADLGGANFVGASLRHCQFTRVNCTSIDFSKADLTGAIWIETNASQASFVDAELIGACLRYCDFSTADLSSPRQHRSQWIACKLDRAQWPQEVTDHSPFAVSSPHPFATVPTKNLSPSVCTGHLASASSAAYSPDGQRIVSASHDTTLRIWDSTDGTPLSTLHGHIARVTSVAYSPDGKEIVSASHDKTLIIWNAQTGAKLHTLRGHDGWVTSADYSPDGQTIVSASADRTLRIWNAHNGAPLRTLSGHDSAVEYAVYSPNGQRIVSASADKTLRIWDARNGDMLHILKGNDGWVTSADYSPDGTKIVSASQDGTLRVWDVLSGTLDCTLKGHTNRITGVAYSPDGRSITSISWDSTLRIWDTGTGTIKQTLQSIDHLSESLAYSPDGRHIVSTPVGSGLYIWDVDAGKLILTLGDRYDSVTKAAYSPDGQEILPTSKFGSTHIWDAQTGSMLRTFQEAERWITSAAYSPDGKRIVLTPWDKPPSILDAYSGETLLSFQSNIARSMDAAYSPDGQRIVLALEDQTLRIWDASSGVLLYTLKGHDEEVSSVAYSPDGQQITSASQGKTLRIWNANNGTLLLKLTLPNDLANSVAYSPDGQSIVSGSLGRSIHIWDSRSGKLRLTLIGHEGSVNYASYSPDGQTIVSASNDRTLRIWDARSGAQLKILTGHDDSATSAVYSPDGKTILSASCDATLRVWDADSGACLRTHHHLSDGEYFSHTGADIASGEPLAASAGAWRYLGLQPTSGPIDRYPIDLDPRYARLFRPTNAQQ